MKILLLISAVILFSTSNILSQSNSTELSQLRFSATDKKGKAITNLTKDDISLTVGKTQLTVENLESQSDKPLEVILLIDTTPSQEKILPMAKKIAMNFIDQILNSNKDYVSIAIFANTKFNFTPLTNIFATAKKDIDSIKSAKGNSYIFDSISYINKNGFSTSKDKRKIILLISDGVDTSSRTNSKKLSAELISSNVRLFTLRLKDINFNQASRFNSTILGNFDENGILSISKDSGGKSFLIDNITKDEKINKFLSEIKENLLGDYAIRFSIEKLPTKAKTENINIKPVGKSAVNLLYQSVFYSGN